jgi:hypothetical protein
VGFIYLKVFWYNRRAKYVFCVLWQGVTPVTPWSK